MAMEPHPLLFLLALFLPFHLPPPASAAAAATHKVCVVGAGIAGSSIAHFLTDYSAGAVRDILVLDRRSKVGGRMSTVTVAGDTFEAGGTIIHPRNLHALNFTDILGLRRRTDPDDSWFGIWNGEMFVWKTLRPPPRSSWKFWKAICSLVNSLLTMKRYGLSLLRMNSFVKDAVNKFVLYYKALEDRPVFETVEEMLKWSGLYGLTQRTLEEELADAGLSPLLISELITVITRINYGQSVSISGLAGAVSLAGSEDGLWSVDGGNWQMAAGLIKLSNASLLLQEEVTAISYVEGYYELTSADGNSYSCGVAVIATPLDEQNITFTPPISIPSRKSQHTYATFVRGALNPAYFGLKSLSEIPELIGTIEVPGLPFSSINILRRYGEEDLTYKVFSRAHMTDALLDAIFSVRKATVQINWPAYPRYVSPEVFAPFLLDGKHLYYVNSFESAASTMETSAVAAENVARLILSRLKVAAPNTSNLRTVPTPQKNMHMDL